MSKNSVVLNLAVVDGEKLLLYNSLINGSYFRHNIATYLWK